MCFVWVLNLCSVCGRFVWIGYDLVAVILLLCYFVSIGNLVCFFFLFKFNSYNKKLFI